MNITVHSNEADLKWLKKDMHEPSSIKIYSFSLKIQNSKIQNNNSNTMVSHSTYSSATTWQFSYQNSLKKRNNLVRPCRMKFKERNVGRKILLCCTHFMSRMFPGEYCTNNVLIPNPHWTHLYSISLSMRLNWSGVSKELELLPVVILIPWPE